jgi:hypothetical protein
VNALVSRTDLRLLDDREHSDMGLTGWMRVTGAMSRFCGADGSIEVGHAPSSRILVGDRSATNQIPYSLNNRSVELDLMQWCKQHEMPVMAYSPLGGDNNLVIHNPTLAQVAAAHGCFVAAVALSWWSSAVAT